MTDYVRAFADGDRSMRDLLGGKGANLAEMTAIGLPVPDGFTITTEACLAYLGSGNTWPEGLHEQVAAAVAALEQRVGQRLGGDEDPLLVSVRSGAPVSMPGMMDTILNLGLNDRSTEALARRHGRRAVCPRLLPAADPDVRKRGHGRATRACSRTSWAAPSCAVACAPMSSSTPADLQTLVERFLEIYQSQTGQPFPQSPADQLDRAVEAVFGSWNTPRAIAYRRKEHLSDDLGTAVNVQQMVFGNTGERSGTGVAFSRNPSTGEHVPYGEFLENAQGEDVVSGVRTGLPLTELERIHPDIHRRLLEVMAMLERHYGDMQDMEFTVDRGQLYMLQTRSGKRDPRAALRIAVEMVAEGVIDREVAVTRVDAHLLEHVLRPTVSARDEHPVIATGLPACAGAAVGKVVFDAATAVEWADAGESVVPGARRDLGR